MLDLLAGITIGFLGFLTVILWAAGEAHKRHSEKQEEERPVQTRKPLVPTAEYSPKNEILREAIREGDTDLLRVNLSHVEQPEDLPTELFCRHLAVVVANAPKLPVAMVRTELEKIYD